MESCGAFMGRCQSPALESKRKQKLIWDWKNHTFHTSETSRWALLATVFLLFLVLWYLTAAVQIFSTLVKSYPKEKILPPTLLKWLMSALSHIFIFFLSPLVSWANGDCPLFPLCHVLRLFAVLNLYFKGRAVQSNWWMDFESKNENSRTMATFFFLTE